MSHMKALISIHRLVEQSPRLILQWAWTERLWQSRVKKFTQSQPQHIWLEQPESIMQFKGNLKLLNHLKHLKVKLLGKKSQSYSPPNVKFYTAQSTGTRIHTFPASKGGSSRRHITEAAGFTCSQPL